MSRPITQSSALPQSPGPFRCRTRRATLRAQQSLLAAAVTVAALALYRPLHADYTAANTLDLNPAGFTQSYAKGAGGSLQGGQGASAAETGGVWHAMLYTGTGASRIDVNPTINTVPYTQSYILAGDLNRFVGGGYAPNVIGQPDGTNNTDQALFWSIAPNGTVTTVNINPAGNLLSYANSIRGTQITGYAHTNSGLDHAYLWLTTNLAAPIDLNAFLPAAPANGPYTISYAFGTNGAKQIGYGYYKDHGNTYYGRAMLWSGNSGTAVDLTPATGFTETYGAAITANNQFGVGYGTATGGTNWALMWSGTAASYQNITPAGFTAPRINNALDTINGTQVVGVALSGVDRAILWTNPTAGSPNVTDLHALLPGSPTKSYASSIDIYGNITGYAYFPAAPTMPHAVTWLAGDTYKIAGGTGTWNTPANWLGGLVPTAAHDVFLLQSGGTNRALAFANPSVVALNRLVIDATGSGTFTLTQAQDTMTFANETLGYVGSGKMDHSGGTHNVTGALTLAAKPGSTGTYLLSGTGVLNATNLTINTGGAFTQTAGTLVAGPTLNAGSLTLGGSATLGNLDGVTSGTTAAQLSAAGATAVNPNALASAARIRQTSLTLLGDSLNNAGKITLSESSPTFAQNSLAPAGNDAFVSVLKTLAIDHAGNDYFATLDLTNNDLIIDYSSTGVSPVTTIEAMVRSGYNAGAWTGKGITSSAAAANPNRFALIVIDNATNSTHYATFDGIDTSGHQQVIVKFSWVADLDLDGLITTNDAITFAANYSLGAPANHQRGDLNYNGVYDSNDAILFAAAYNTSLPSLPEPASLAILALGTGALLLRRKP